MRWNEQKMKNYEEEGRKASNNERIHPLLPNIKPTAGSLELALKGSCILLKNAGARQPWPVFPATPTFPFN
jgi:hypothetical protein